MKTPSYEIENKIMAHNTIPKNDIRRRCISEIADFFKIQSKTFLYLKNYAHYYSWQFILTKMAENVFLEQAEEFINNLENLRKQYFNKCDVCKNICLSDVCIRQICDSDSDDEQEVCDDIYKIAFLKLKPLTKFKFSEYELPNRKTHGIDWMFQIYQRKAMFSGTLAVGRIKSIRTKFKTLDEKCKLDLFLHYFNPDVEQMHSLSFQKYLYKLHQVVKHKMKSPRRSFRLM